MQVKFALRKKEVLLITKTNVLVWQGYYRSSMSNSKAIFWKHVLLCHKQRTQARNTILLYITVIIDVQHCTFITKKNQLCVNNLSFSFIFLLDNCSNWNVQQDSYCYTCIVMYLLLLNITFNEYVKLGKSILVSQCQKPAIHVHANLCQNTFN